MKVRNIVTKKNVAIVYSLSELDKLENILSCPFNKKEYTKDGTAEVHYDQNNKELSLSTKLQCGNRVINYHCDIKNDIIDSNCEFDIYKK